MQEQTYKCPYCDSEAFTNEFIELQEEPIKGYSQCADCARWSAYEENTGGLQPIDEPNVKPVV